MCIGLSLCVLSSVASIAPTELRLYLTKKVPEIACERSCLEVDLAILALV